MVDRLMNNRDVSLTLWLMSGLLLLLFFLALSLWWGISGGWTSDSVIGTLLVLGILGHAGFSVLRVTNGGIGFDLGHPPTAYGLFFVMFHVLPYLFATITGIIPVRHHLPIAFLYCLAYTGWQIGCRLAKAPTQPTISADFLKRSDAKALLITCFLAIALIGYSHATRLAHGTFYRQAQKQEVVERTVEFSIREVVVFYLELPILLLLGFLAHHADRSLSFVARRVFYSYTVGLFLIYMCSSRSRPAINVLLFFFLSLGLHRRFLLRPVHVCLLACLGVTTVLIVQGLRMSRVDLYQSDNQFTHVLTNTFSLGLGTAAESMPTTIEQTGGRACNGIVFLSEMLDATENHPHLYGAGILAGLSGLIPRVIWPDKPDVVAYESVVEEHFDMFDHDTAPTSIGQFYAECGYWGVGIGHLLLGLLLGRILFLLTSRPQLPLLLVLFFIWGRIGDMEDEIVLSVLSVLRIAALLYLVYWIVRFYTANPRDSALYLDQRPGVLVNDSARRGIH